ncbi:MAG: GntR family transcriptional regulator [Verrucomicrobiota bacterium]
MASEPKHRSISQQLQTEIASGKYGAGGKLPSESKLVERFNVSRPTIDRALRDLQTDGLIERKAGSGTYVRNSQSGALNTRQLGLLIPGLGSTEIFELICGELASLARVHEYSLLLGGPNTGPQDGDSNLDHATELCSHFIDRKVSGVFFAPFELRREKEGASQRLAERLRQAGIAVVLLDRDLVSFPRRSDFDLVNIDNFAGGYLLAEHLIKLGAKRIAFVARPFSAPSVDTRIAGVREALARFHIDTTRNWVQFGDPADIKFTRNLSAGNPWDAIICANDHTAAVLMRSLEQQKVRVPRDIKVVGFDDVKYATLLGVPLTTIHQPCRDIALSAFRAMLERIAEPILPARNILLSPSLIVRESCGAYLPR